MMGMGGSVVIKTRDNVRSRQEAECKGFGCGECSECSSGATCNRAMYGWRRRTVSSDRVLIKLRVGHEDCWIIIRHTSPSPQTGDRPRKCNTSCLVWNLPLSSTRQCCYTYNQRQHILGCFGMEVLSAATPTECNPFTFMLQAHENYCTIRVQFKNTRTKQNQITAGHTQAQKCSNI